VAKSRVPAGAGKKINNRNDVIDNAMILIVIFSFVSSVVIIAVMIALYYNVAIDMITL
jgi:hypothetical protein